MDEMRRLLYLVRKTWDNYGDIEFIKKCASSLYIWRQHKIRSYWFSLSLGQCA